MLSSFWDSLTWHVAIEVFAIILAAMIVHPVMGMLQRLFRAMSQILAASSQRRAISKTKSLLDQYARLWSMRMSFKEWPYKATMYNANQNLSMVMICMSILVIIGNALALALPLSLIAFLFALYRYNIILTERINISNIDDFRIYIQNRVLQLRSVANNDQELRKLWEAYFDQDFPN